MEYSLGIDFGTSTTKIALCQTGQEPHPLPIGSKGDLYMPSVVRYRRIKNDQAELMAVGENALTDIVTEDMRVVTEIKRLLISGEVPPQDSVVRDRYTNWDWKNKRVKLWSSSLSPYDIAMIIMEEALKRAVNKAREEGLGSKIDHFTIKGLPCRMGCPVRSGLEARQTLAEIAKHLGFHDFSISAGLYEEPVLAALEYVRHDSSTKDDTVLVYDFGGGSFDTAIVRVIDEGGQKKATVLSADGEPFCGGSDIDKYFGEYLADRIVRENMGLPPSEESQLTDRMSLDQANTLNNEARNVKEALSGKGETYLPLDFLGRKDDVLRVERSELEEVIKKRGIIARTTSCALRNFWRVRMFDRNEDESLQSYYLHEHNGVLRPRDHVMGLTHSDLNNYVTKILLVGGITKIPLVRETLRKIWDESKFIEANVVEPMEACAMGAAWRNDNSVDPIHNRSIVDRLPFSVILRGAQGEYQAYKAYEPIVRYERPPMKEYWSQEHINSRRLSVVYKYSDGDEQVSCEIADGIAPYQLRFDIFGNIFLKDVMKERRLDNPFQSPQQKRMYEWKLARERHEEEAERQIRQKYFNQGPYEEHQTG